MWGSRGFNVSLELAINVLIFVTAVFLPFIILLRSLRAMFGKDQRKELNVYGP
jgi:hypothetical protein